MTQVFPFCEYGNFYALEAVKPTQRVPRRSEVEEVITNWRAKAEHGMALSWKTISSSEP